MIVRENYHYKFNIDEIKTNACCRHSLYTYMMSYDDKFIANKLIREYNLDKNMKTRVIYIRNPYESHCFSLYSNVTKLSNFKGNKTQDGYLISLFIKFDFSCYCIEIEPYHYIVDFDINKTLTPQEQQILNNKRENSNNYGEIKHFIDLIKSFLDVKLIYNEPKILLENISRQDVLDLRYLRHVKCNWIKTDFNRINLDAIIAYICKNIFLNYNNIVKIYLFEYKLYNLETFYEYDREGFAYFKNIYNVTIIQEINCYSYMEISSRQNMFIQINFEKEGNRQNYYLFLPTLSLKLQHFTSFFGENHFFNDKLYTTLLEKPIDKFTENHNPFIINITKKSLLKLEMDDVFLLCNNQNLKDSKLESIIFRNILSSDDILNQSDEILSLFTIEEINYLKKEVNLRNISSFNTPFYYLYNKLTKYHVSKIFQRIFILIKEYCVLYGKKYEDNYDENYKAYFRLAVGNDYFLDNRYDEIVELIHSYKINIGKDEKN